MTQANIAEIREMEDGAMVVLEAKVLEPPELFTNVTGRGKWRSRAKMRVQDEAGLSIGVTCWDAMANKVSEQISIRDIGKPVTIAGKVNVRSNPKTNKLFRSLSVNDWGGQGIEVGEGNNNASTQNLATIHTPEKAISAYDFLDLVQAVQAKMTLDGIENPSPSQAAVIALAVQLGVIDKSTVIAEPAEEDVPVEGAPF